ncbi:MAG TPA: pyridoxamine 5'-phosphate oxidase family protein [Pseudonocardiaceae bacterium]
MGSSSPAATGRADWQTFADDAPDLARAVRARFEAFRHHVLATLRADGSPRASGSEVDFWRREATLGSMVNARKALDLLRDPRCAVHSNPGPGTDMALGDARLTGHAIEASEETRAAYIAERHPPEPLHLFLLELTEVTLTWLDGENIMAATWRPSGVTAYARPPEGEPRRLTEFTVPG